MYELFYGFKEKPFSLTPDPAFLYLGSKHSTGLTMLQYGLTNRAGVTILTGEVGSGKTTLIRKLLDEVEEDIAVGLISNTHSSFGNLMQWVVDLHRKLTQVLHPKLTHLEEPEYGSILSGFSSFDRLRLFRRAVFEAVAVVAGLDDMTVMRQSVQ